MPVASGERPFGLADVKLTPLPSGVLTDVPVARSLEFGFATDTADLTGDDGLANTRTYNIRVEGGLEYGGINPAVLAAILGATATTTGTTAADYKTVVAVTKTTVPGYLKIEGKAASDDVATSDFHVVVYYAKFAAPSWTLEGGTYLISSADFIGIPDGAGKLADFVWNETAKAIA